MAGAQTCLIYIMIIIQIMGILTITMIAVWLAKHAAKPGFGVGDENELVNLHALMMPIALLFLANGVVMYRAFRKFRARNVKYVHFIFHLIALVLLIIGFVFTILARSKAGESSSTFYDEDGEDKDEGGDGAKHFYSGHSWLGLMCFILVVFQFLGGLIVFLCKAVDKNGRELFAAVHAFFGIFIVLLAGLVCCIGIEGKAKSDIPDYDTVPTPGILANVATLAIIIMLAHVLYMSVNPFFEWDVNDETLEANPIE